MTLVEQNEKLAKFMGGHHSEGIWIFNGDDELPQNTVFLLFNTSWNWLMPVVEKLDSTDVNIHIDEDRVYVHFLNKMMTFTNNESGSKIMAIYEAVCAGVEFLERLDKTAKAL